MPTNTTTTADTDWPALVRRIRQQSGLSQAKLAARITRELELDEPMHHSTVLRWEGGISEPHPYLRERLRQMAIETEPQETGS